MIRIENIDEYPNLTAREYYDNSSGFRNNVKYVWSVSTHDKLHARDLQNACAAASHLLENKKENISLNEAISNYKEIYLKNNTLEKFGED